MTDVQNSIAEIEAITAGLKAETESFEKEGEQALRGIHADFLVNDQEFASMLNEVTDLNNADATAE